jgi:hypothetical protein
MALANRKDWNLRQNDFKNAFLNAKMAKELYMNIKRHVERDDKKGIVTLGLKFHHDENLNLEGHVDGTHEGNRRSTTGWCFRTGGPILPWKAHNQSTVATGTAEAEYITEYEATKEAV